MEENIRDKMLATLTQALPYLPKELGVSQTVLAQKVGMSRQMISLIERGEHPMTWTQFLAVFFFKSNTDFEKGAKSVAKKQANIVEQILLLELDMNQYKKRG